MTHLLSIVIPVYNAAATVARTMSSLNHINERDRPRVQVIVVNDGSTDDSRRVISCVQSTISGFEWLNLDQANEGLSGARNAALAKATGEWIWFLDADDELQLDVARELSLQPSFSSIGFTVEYFRHGRRLAQVKPQFVARETHLDILSAMNPFQPSALVFKRAAISQVFDTSINVVNDWLFWLQNPGIFEAMLVQPGQRIARIHIHGGNMSRGYTESGRNRAEVARRMLTSTAYCLSAKQRNNFLIQQQIGLIQQGCRFSPRMISAWPCDASLYGKALIYIAASMLRLRATAY